MALYFSSNESTLPTLEQIGGKGLSLLHSNKKGFNVPFTVVLSTKFFQPWISLLKATLEWKVFAQAKDVDMVAAATAVKNSCQVFAFSEDQQRPLFEIRQHLQAEQIIFIRQYKMILLPDKAIQARQQKNV